MSRLDEYQTALLAADPGVSADSLCTVLDNQGTEFVSFIVDHGLGPQWHLRTGREAFKASRRSAEALFLAQQHALADIDKVLNDAGVEYVLIKGAANRLQLYDNPAIRACHDLDVLVRPQDKVRAASALVGAGFEALPERRNIAREMVLTRADVDIDLHWALLREGRLRSDITADLLSRRQRISGLWVLGNEDAVFALLVHPAFAKHLAGYLMGLHRVMDIAAWFAKRPFDWETVQGQLAENGVQTAAWATLRWVQLLQNDASNMQLDKYVAQTFPGRLRRWWLENWLQRNLSERTGRVHALRLLGFSAMLQDTAADSLRAFRGRLRAYQRRDVDFAEFDNLSRE